MRVGPRGEKRPSNPNAMSTMVARIATGRAEEEYVSRKHGRAKDEGIPLMATKTKATEPASKKSKDNP